MRKQVSVAAQLVQSDRDVPLDYARLDDDLPRRHAF